MHLGSENQPDYSLVVGGVLAPIMELFSVLVKQHFLQRVMDDARLLDIDFCTPR